MNYHRAPPRRKLLVHVVKTRLARCVKRDLSHVLDDADDLALCIRTDRRIAPAEFHPYRIATVEITRHERLVHEHPRGCDAIAIVDGEIAARQELGACCFQIAPADDALPA